MLNPTEATPRALAMLTLAHELYSATDEERAERALFDTDHVLEDILRGDDDEVDWQSIAVGLAMVGHVLLDHIPAVIYKRAEAAVADMMVKNFDAIPDSVEVSLPDRLDGFDILRELSLEIAKMNAQTS